MTLLCHSKVAGVSSGPKAESRQKCLAFLSRYLKVPRSNPVELRLVPEPENPYDPDAIRVEFEYGEGEFFHLGYIPNSDTICRECNEMFERHPGGNSCPNCGRKGHLERHGTATRINNVSGYRGVRKVANVTEITGGLDGKSLGCNIAVYAEE